MARFGLVSEGITDQIVLVNYRTCSKGYQNQKMLFKSCPHNHSFAYFIQELQQRNITMEVEDDW